MGKTIGKILTSKFTILTVILVLFSIYWEDIYFAIAPHNSRVEQRMRVLGRSRVSYIDFSPDGKLLASRAVDGIQVWNAQTGALVETLTRAEGITNKLGHGPVLFSPDGKSLLGIDSGLFVWDTQSWKVRDTQTSGSKAAISPDSRMVALAGTNEVELWNFGTWKYKQSFPIGMDPEDVSFSPNSKVLAVASSDWDTITYMPGGKVEDGHHSFLVQLWNLETGKTIRTFKHDDYINEIAFTPDGKKIASASGNKVQLWDLATGKTILTFKRRSRVIAIAITSDGKTIASASDNTVQLRDLTTGKIIDSFNNKGVVYAIAFTPDGKRIAAATNAGLIEITPIGK